MTIKFEKIQPGMRLYDRHKRRMGNTKLKTVGEWEVRIISVDQEKRTAQVSWNGNRVETYHERQLTRLSEWSMHDDCAEVVRGMLDRVVKVTKKRATPAASPR